MGGALGTAGGSRGGPESVVQGESILEERKLFAFELIELRTEPRERFGVSSKIAGLRRGKRWVIAGGVLAGCAAIVPADQVDCRCADHSTEPLLLRGAGIKLRHGADDAKHGFLNHIKAKRLIFATEGAGLGEAPVEPCLVELGDCCGILPMDATTDAHRIAIAHAASLGAGICRLGQGRLRGGLEVGRKGVDGEGVADEVLPGDSLGTGQPDGV